METKFEQRIDDVLRNVIYPWKEQGEFMHVYLKCQLKSLQEGHKYCVRMSSPNPPEEFPDPIGSSFKNIQETEYTTEATHAFTTPLKIFKFHKTKQVLQFTIFLLSNSKNHAIQGESCISQYCSVEVTYQKVCQYVPTALKLKSEDGKELAELTCSIMVLEDSDEEKNKISLNFTINIKSKSAKYINKSQLKIFGEGNKQKGVIEIYSSDWITTQSDNYDKLNASFVLENILLSSIFGNKKKPFCWGQQNEESKKEMMFLEFPVYKQSILERKQQQAIQILNHYEEPFPMLNLKEIQQQSFSIASASYFISDVEIKDKYSFKEYLFAGLNINLAIGIDFTQSNEKQSTYLSNEQNCQAKSLHNFTEIDKNPYLKSLDGAGNVITQFCNNNLPIHMYGFGGILNTTTQTPSPFQATSHCFPLIHADSSTMPTSLKGMLRTYLTSIDKVTLKGPSNLQPLIEHTRATALSKRSISDKNYIILLIITDGIINDMIDTEEEIMNCINVPISIIIVGVGDEEFDDMKYLSNRFAQYGRDIVTFVKIDEYDDLNGKQFYTDIVKKLPEQVTQYYEHLNKKPHEMETHLKTLFKQDLAQKEHTSGTQDKYLKKIDAYQQERFKKL